ncbi:hypothetical protein BDW62DRAFT_118578 [Aspergillus aurantiobrunneus]
MTTVDVEEYLNDLGFDPSDYGLDEDDFDLSDYDVSDYDTSSYDISDYLPTSTESSSSYPTSSYDYDDYLDDDDSYGSSGSSSSDFDWDNLPTSGGPSSGDIPSSDLPYGLGSYGSIGTDYSNQQTSGSCVSELAFKTTGPKVDLAFDVIFLVLFVAIAGVAGFRLLKSKQKGAAIGKWFLFPASLFFAILYLFIDFITLILSQCVMMRIDKYQQALTAVKWFDSLSVFLLIVLILLPICLKLQGGGNIATLTLIVHGAWLALCGIFLLVSLAIYSRIQDAIYRTGDSVDLSLARASRGVSMTYYVFLFLAALLGGANMFFALFRKSNIRKGTLLLATPALILSTLVLTLVLMGGFADHQYGSATRSPSYIERSGDAQIFLTRLFYAIAFLSALAIAGSHQATDDSAAQPVPPMSQPANEYQQPVAPVPAPALAPAPQHDHAPVPAPAPYGPAQAA